MRRYILSINLCITGKHIQQTRVSDFLWMVWNSHLKNVIYFWTPCITLLSCCSFILLTDPSKSFVCVFFSFEGSSFSHILAQAAAFQSVSIQILKFLRATRTLGFHIFQSSMFEHVNVVMGSEILLLFPSYYCWSQCISNSQALPRKLIELNKWSRPAVINK